MPEVPPKRRSPQRAEDAGKKSGRLRRITEMFPEHRELITPLFHRGLTVERIAEELEINIEPGQLLEHVVRDYVGAKHPGLELVRKGPQSETRMTVHEFNKVGRLA